MRTAAHRARHRLGMPGLVHCVRHPEVAVALEEFHRGWLWALLTPARHSLAGLRRRAIAAAAQQAWTPRPA
ncbi:MAG TPA: hypothetical protein VGJ95_11400 [Pseudonocardiaceae bacterium]|jgi:hypothetical protein